MPRKALFIGINHYNKAPKLKGCINDATRMHSLLSRNADDTLNFEGKLLTSDRYDVSAAELRKNIVALFIGTAEASIFYYSGHGALRDYGGFLVTKDAAQYHEGVDMHSVLALANAAVLEGRHRQVLIILDCCHSGAFGDLQAGMASPTVIHEGVSILTASKADEVSVESKGQGLFTTSLCNALEGAAADLLGRVTVGSVYSHLDQLFGAWQQRPMLKVNVSTLLVLRKCHSAVPMETLLKLNTLFEASHHELPLTPEHEPSHDTPDQERVGDYLHLQQLFHAGLVRPKNEAFMYHAAMKSDSIVLSPLGKYYREVVGR